MGLPPPDLQATPLSLGKWGREKCSGDGREALALLRVLAGGQQNSKTRKTSEFYRVPVSESM